MKKNEKKVEDIEKVVPEDRSDKREDSENIDDSQNNQESLEDESVEDISEIASEDKSDEEDSDTENQQKDYKELADEYLVKLQRLQAEFDNFRKREEKQQLMLKDLITENIVQDILPVVDNFERATHASMNENTTLESFVEGVNLVYQQFESFLTDLNIKRMDALGEKFDPEKHNAVSKASSEEYEEDMISQVLQNGWILNEKVIRHAMVVVSSGAATE